MKKFHLLLCSLILALMPSCIVYKSPGSSYGPPVSARPVVGLQGGVVLSGQRPPCGGVYRGPMYSGGYSGGYGGYNPYGHGGAQGWFSNGRTQPVVYNNEMRTYGQYNPYRR